MGPQLMVNGHDNSPSVQHRNPLTKPWVVQKFGGTSVGKFANRIAEDLVRSEDTPMPPMSSSVPGIDAYLGRVSPIIALP